MLRFGSPDGNESPDSLSAECFFIHYIRHLCDVAAVVAFEDIDQPLHTASSHALVGISREARNARGTGKMRQQTAAIRNCRIA